jgi:hypothetical protein
MQIGPGYKSPDLCSFLDKLFEPITLSQVLIALNLDEECWLMLKHLRIPKENGATIFWDLTKQTLEEQSEETQREINELFN